MVQMKFSGAGGELTIWPRPRVHDGSREVGLRLYRLAMRGGAHKSPWKGERSTKWEKEKYTHTIYINTQVVWLYGIKATFTTRPQLDPNYTHTHIMHYYYYYYYYYYDYYYYYYYEYTVYTCLLSFSAPHLCQHCLVAVGFLFFLYIYIYKYVFFFYFFIIYLLL